MPRSSIFYTEKRRELEGAISELLNSQPDFLSSRTAGSTRAVGDAIQEIISENFESLLGSSCSEYSATFARRAMADLAFTDVDGFYYVVDVKTHRVSTSFNMPNLTSVERLVRFYEDDQNYFSLLMIRYDVSETKITVENVHFVPIEFLSWDCLTIGALGWGQIQIANANRIEIVEGQARKQWMVDLCDIMLSFYPKEITKIGRRLEYFTATRERWMAKPD